MRVIALAGLLCFASNAFAQEGIYVGLGVGSFDYEEPGGSLSGNAISESVTSLRIYGGFEFNENFAFEVRYGTTSEIKDSFSGTDPILGDFTAQVDFDFTTTSIAGMGMLPKDWGAFFAGIGYFDTTANIDFNLTADCCGMQSSSASVGDDGIMALLGIEWRFGRFNTGIGVRVEYEWLDLEDADGSTVGVGISYRF
jgi:opacity protein-like surface antigen